MHSDVCIVQSLATWGPGKLLESSGDNQQWHRVGWLQDIVLVSLLCIIKLAACSCNETFTYMPKVENI